MANFDREAALKRQVIKLFAAIAAGHPLDETLVAADYRPRCAPLPGVPTLEPGRAALKRRLAQRASIPHRLYRWIGDGDYVWTHGRYDGAAPVAGIDIFRFDANDRVVEHWNVREIIRHDAAKGCDRFSGSADTAAVIDDARRTEMKELLVRSQVDVWGHARADLVPVYYDEGYVQHNPAMPGGFQRILHLVSTEMKARLERTGKPFPIDVHLLGANGDVVFMYYTVPMAGIGRNTDETARNADIFRIDARNKLIEHWDVLQMGSEPLPNDRTLF